MADTNGNGMSLPEGYRKIVQTRQWFIKSEGAILQGTILRRIARKNEEDKFFYEVCVERECQVTGEKDDEVVIAAPGSIVCIDEFAANANWANLIPDSRGAGFSIWMKFLKKEKIEGTNRTIWRTEQGNQKRPNVRADVGGDDIPF